MLHSKRNHYKEKPLLAATRDKSTCSNGDTAQPKINECTEEKGTVVFLAGGMKGPFNTSECGFSVRIMLGSQPHSNAWVKAQRRREVDLFRVVVQPRRNHKATEGQENGG